MKTLQKVLEKAKKDFIQYLRDIDKAELIHRVDELFNYKVLPNINKIKLMLSLNGEEVFSRDMDVDDLLELPSILKDSLKEEMLGVNSTIKLQFDDEIVFSEDIKFTELGDIDSILKDNKERVFNEIGYYDITLMHNNNNELLKVKLHTKRLDILTQEIYDNRDEIYQRYIKKEDRIRETVFYGDGIATNITGEILEGKFIVDEFENFIADETGACLVFE